MTLENYSLDIVVDATLGNEQVLPSTISEEISRWEGTIGNPICKLLLQFTENFGVFP